MTEAQVRDCAHGVERGSRRHLATSIAVGAVVFACEAGLGGGPVAYVFVVLVTGMLVACNVGRIRSARRAVTGSLEAARAYVLGQRRSHLIRGQVFLVGAPVILAITWAAALRVPLPVFGWVVLLGGTGFLAYGWGWWWRALPRVRRWSA